MKAEAVRKGLIDLGYPAEKVDRFLAWQRSAPEVWREFERITLELIFDGKKAGAMDILAKVRWECEIIGGKDFKCNNSYAPFLSRVFIMKHPKHAGYFEFREVGYEREAA